MISSVQSREDTIDRLVCDLPAEEFVSWMIKYHGLPSTSRDTVVSNLNENQRWHRLRGRLDRVPLIWSLIEIWLKRRGKESTCPKT